VVSLLDPVFRFAAVGILALGAIAATRRARHERAAWLVAAFLACLVAYLLCSSPALTGKLGALGPPLRMLAIAAPALFWLASLAMFSDSFRLRAAHFVPLLALDSLGFAGGYLPPWSEAAGWLHHALVLGLYAHTVFVAWSGLAGDLIEARRRFRVVFVASTSALGAAIALAEVVLRGQAAPGWLELVKVAVIAALAAALVAWWLEPRAAWFGAHAAPRPLSAGDELPPAERRVLEALRHAIAEEKRYRTEGLTTAELAAQLRAPQHLVRKVINQRLGHRNFNAFLNHYRLAEARSALADPAQMHLPVLTIALQAGFGSIGPFNRAFKDAYGVTPTQFRQSSAAADSTNMSPLPESAMDF
jgi:AraC-like DNA-binding protein